MIFMLQIISFILELIAAGLAQSDAVERASNHFGIDVEQIRKWL